MNDTPSASPLAKTSSVSNQGGFWNWLLNLFTPRRAVVCPFCLNYSSLRKGDINCNAYEGCHRVLPEVYLEYCEKLPPLFVPILGFTNHGKTFSILGQVNALGSATLLGPDYYRQWADEATLAWLRQKVKGAVEGQEVKPDGTQSQIPEAFILLLHNLPRRWHGPRHTGRTLVIRDFAGEDFKNAKVPPDRMAFIAASPVVMLQYSLNDLENPVMNKANFSIDDLLACYVNSIGHAAMKKRRLNMIVCLTKSDELLKQNKLPSHLVDYLIDDPIAAAIKAGKGTEYWNDEQFADYMDRLERASLAIRDYLEERHPSARMMIRMAKNNNINLFYCITSSTGGVNVDTESGKAESEWQPLRILDPLFTALEFGVRKNEKW